MRFRSISSLVSCGGNFVASDELQTFSTPNWPDNYPSNQDCFWVINEDGSGIAFELIVGQGQIKPNSDFVAVR